MFSVKINYFKLDFRNEYEYENDKYLIKLIKLSYLCLKIVPSPTEIQ